MIQEQLIARVRSVCEEDPGLSAALMYGSFASGEADEYSDIEFWLFFTPRSRASLDPAAWCGRIAPVTHLLLNEFGTHVAFFPGLIRGEFHFAATDDMFSVRDWPARSGTVDRMILLDRTKELAPILRALPERAAAPGPGTTVEDLCGRFANWLVLAHHTAARGEYLRAWDALGHVQRHLVWMARLAEHSTVHWLTPSRCAEAELSPTALSALRQATASADPQELDSALRAAWRTGRDLWRVLLGEVGQLPPSSLVAELDAAFGAS